MFTEVVTIITVALQDEIMTAVTEIATAERDIKVDQKSDIRHHVMHDDVAGQGTDDLGHVASHLLGMWLSILLSNLYDGQSLQFM